MTNAAAKGGKLFFLAAAIALCAAILAAPAAEATRTLPAIAEPAQTHQRATLNVLEDATPRPPTQPEKRLRLFGDLSWPTHPLELVQISKTASGVFDLGLDCNILEKGGLSQDCGSPSFQGLWHDPTTGLAYARNRWYDARTANWLSEDPLGPVDSPNLYAGFGWMPHSATDPMGENLITDPSLVDDSGMPHYMFNGSAYKVNTRTGVVSKRVGDGYSVAMTVEERDVVSSMAGVEPLNFNKEETWMLFVPGGNMVVVFNIQQGPKRGEAVATDGESFVVNGRKSHTLPIREVTVTSLAIDIRNGEALYGRTETFLAARDYKHRGDQAPWMRNSSRLAEVGSEDFILNAGDTIQAMGEQGRSVARLASGWFAKGPQPSNYPMKKVEEEKARLNRVMDNGIVDTRPVIDPVKSVLKPFALLTAPLWVVKPEAGLGGYSAAQAIQWGSQSAIYINRMRENGRLLQIGHWDGSLATTIPAAQRGFYSSFSRF